MLFACSERPSHTRTSSCTRERTWELGLVPNMKQIFFTMTQRFHTHLAVLPRNDEEGRRRGGVTEPPPPPPADPPPVVRVVVVVVDRPPRPLTATTATAKSSLMTMTDRYRAHSPQSKAATSNARISLCGSGAHWLLPRSVRPQRRRPKNNDGRWCGTSSPARGGSFLLGIEQSLSSGAFIKLFHEFNPQMKS